MTIAAVLGREFDLIQLVPLIEDLTEDQLLEVLEDASAARIIEEIPRTVGRYQFTHALIRETLIEELSTTRRVRLHARVAGALETLYGPDAEGHAAELAHHFYEAEAVLGNDRLVRYSLLAGEQALAATAHEEALAHFETGLNSKEGQPMDAETAALFFGLARAQVATLSVAQVQQGFDSLSRAFDYYVEAGDVTQAVAVADHPLVIIGGMPVSGMAHLITRALELVPADSHQAGRLLSRYGTALGSSASNYEAARKAFDDALVIAQREGDTNLEVRTLVDACRSDGFNLQFQDCMTKALRAIDLLADIDDPGSEVPAHHWAAMISLIQGNLEEAEAHALAMITPAERSRLRQLLEVAYWTNAPVAHMKGDWEAALEFVSRGFDASPQHVQFQARRTLIEYELGDFSQGEEYLEELLDTGIPLRGVGLLFFKSMTLALVARITGNNTHLDLALSQAETLSSLHHSPLTEMAASQILGLVAVLREDPVAAREQYEGLGTGRVGEYFGRVSSDRVLGLMAYTFGDLDQAAAHFEDGLNFCRGGYRPELAWTYCDYAETLLQRNNPGDRERTISLLEEALILSIELSMRPLNERASRLLEQLSSQPTASPTFPDGLSQREVEVLRLVAAGKNNRDIAEELVVSVGTVANHVTSILNKAGLNNRTEAAGYAFRQGLA